MNEYHIPVLLKEVIACLDIRKGNKYIDATIGGGGHAKEILKNGGLVLGIDRDKDALKYTGENISNKLLKNLILVKANFSDLEKVACKNNFYNPAGILFDLGVSSYQLNTKTRGFSFKTDGPLDMRMNQEEKITVFDLINSLSIEDLTFVLQKFGEEPLALEIALAIKKNKKEHMIKTTAELAKLVKEVYQKKNLFTKINPATKVFQALRICVNSEIDQLNKGLDEAINLLDTGGKLLVISYHSLEDRIVKLKMRSGKLINISKKPIRPLANEILINPRARSAKLRVAEKI